MISKSFSMSKCLGSRRRNKALTMSSSFLLALLSAAVFVSPSFADSSVWVASSGDNKVYLGGTVHLLRPEDFPLPEEYEQAYQDSSQPVFETDISPMNDLSVQAAMLQQLTYTDQDLKNCAQ
jgi:uncharacterized protein